MSKAVSDLLNFLNIYDIVQMFRLVKALVNKETLLPTQMFPHLPPHPRVRNTKNVSDFVEKHFVSAANVFQFVQPKKHHGQQYGLVNQGLNGN